MSDSNKKYVYSYIIPNLGKVVGSLGGGFNDGDTVDGVGPQGGVHRLGLGGFRVDAKN
jgi:hypothetical protein